MVQNKNTATFGLRLVTAAGLDSLNEPAKPDNLVNES